MLLIITFFQILKLCSLLDPSESEIIFVMNETGLTRKEAIKALRKHKNCFEAIQATQDGQQNVVAVQNLQRRLQASIGDV